MSKMAKINKESRRVSDMWFPDYLRENWAGVHQGPRSWLNHHITITSNCCPFTICSTIMFWEAVVRRISNLLPRFIQHLHANIKPINHWDVLRSTQDQCTHASPRENNYIY